MPPQPTLYLHGERDGCVGAEVARMAASDAPPNVHVEIIGGAGHFLHRERSRDVNKRIVEHVTG